MIKKVGHSIKLKRTDIGSIVAQTPVIAKLSRGKEWQEQRSWTIEIVKARLV